MRLERSQNACNATAHSRGPHSRTSGARILLQSHSLYSSLHRTVKLDVFLGLVLRQYILSHERVMLVVAESLPRSADAARSCRQSEIELSCGGRLPRFPVHLSRRSLMKRSSVFEAVRGVEIENVGPSQFD
jgi:hypothetical protein